MTRDTFMHRQRPHAEFRRRLDVIEVRVEAARARPVDRRLVVVSARRRLFLELGNAFDLDSGLGADIERLAELFVELGEHRLVIRENLCAPFVAILVVELGT